MDKFLSSSNPGANVVDSIPVLDGLPDILAPWRKDALKQRAFNQKTYLGLVNDVKDKLQSGGLTDTDCFAATLCDQQEKLGLDDLDIAYLAVQCKHIEQHTGTSMLTLVSCRFEAGRYLAFVPGVIVSNCADLSTNPQVPIQLLQP